MKTHSLVSSAVLCLIASTLPATAQDWNCEDPADLPQQGMNMCAFQDYQKADRALNIIWPQVKAKMEMLDQTNKEYYPTQAIAEENLIKAQRSWIDYRDGHCTAISAEFTGGSIRPLIENSCLASLTRKRTEELLLMLEEN